MAVHPGDPAEPLEEAAEARRETRLVTASVCLLGQGVDQVGLAWPAHRGYADIMPSGDGRCVQPDVPPRSSTTFSGS
jgi:hypothetical protein